MREQRLEGRPDVVELDLLRVEAAPARLDVVLEHLAPLGGAVAVAHRHGPDAPRHAADAPRTRRPCRSRRRTTGWARSCRCSMPRAEVVLDVREAVGEREGELRDRVGARLGDVVAGDRDRVEVAHAAVDEVCWMSPIRRRANSVEKMQVFWAWSSLRMSACTVPRTVWKRLVAEAAVVVRRQARPTPPGPARCSRAGRGRSRRAWAAGSARPLAP